MPDPSRLLLFVSATLLLLVTPGPAVLYIVARSVDQGRAAGLVSALGVNVGILAHVLAAALGVSALLASSPAAFTVVRLPRRRLPALAGGAQAPRASGARPARPGPRSPCRRSSARGSW